MKFRWLIFMAWLAAAISLRAATTFDTLTVGSTVYSNVTVFGANETDLFFKSDSGVSNVKLKFLSPELQKQFHYDPKTAEKVEKQQIQDDRIYQAGLAASISNKVVEAREAREARTKAMYSQAGFGDPVSEDSQLDQTSPQLNFTNWVGGAKADITGKFAIISVWSPKSVSCRKWIPTLNDLHRVLGNRVEFVGVTTATLADVTNSEPKLDFPCALDPDGKFIADAGVQSLPCVLLVDTNDVVRYMGHPAAITTNSLQMLLKNPAESP